jgi:hypothetical protein
MRLFTKYILIFLIFPFASIAQNSQDIKISGRFTGISFQDFADQLVQKYNVHLYFRADWVKSVNVDIDASSISIPQMMDELLAKSKLNYIFIAPGSVYLIPDNKNMYELPDFKYSDNQSFSRNQEDNQILSPENKYLTGRHPDMVETIVIGSRNKANSGKAAVISGKLMEDDTAEPLIGATLYFPDLKKGVATDYDGILTITLNPGMYSVIFQYMGMKVVKCNLDVRSDGYFELSMKKEIQSIQEIVVQGAESAKRGAKLGLESVSVATMKELPSLMGEKDVLRIAQLLPGIVTVGEGSAGINVRGGNSDQNLFFINEIPVYNSSHLFGFFSSINPEIIENFSVYKGQVPAEYGGRLSSVFNIETRKGNKEKFFTQGGVSPVSANAVVDFPLVKEKVSLMLSGRSTYSNWILKQLDDPDLRNSKASFYDFAGNLDFDLNEKNRVNFFAYNSNDKFDMNGYSDYSYGNLGASVNYSHKFSSTLKSDVSIIASNYRFATTEKRLPTESYSHAYSLNHYELKMGVNWLYSEKHTLSGGIDVIRYNLDRGTVRPNGEESLKIGMPLGEENGLETALYLDDNIVLGPRLNFNLGFRFNVFTALGPATVRNYYENVDRNDKNVLDTRTYSGGEKMVTYQYPELRASFDYKLTGQSSVKMSVTQMTQYLFMLSNTISLSPNDQWKLVDEHIRPPKSVQYAAGYFHAVPLLGVSASAEVYYKIADDVVEYKDGADFLSTPYVETTVLQGKQEAYGAEFMLSKDVGKLNGWVSYTYSRSLVTVDGEKDWQDINFGKTFPSNFDKPHVLNLVLNQKLNRRLSLSSTMIYNTGRPITMPQGIYFVGGQPFIDYSARNAYRIPDYLRMDVSVKLEGNLKSKKPMHSYWMLSVYNLTGRKNPNSIFFVSEEGRMQGYKYSIIGVPIVTLSWNWKLGNYANH